MPKWKEEHEVMLEEDEHDPLRKCLKPAVMGNEDVHDGMRGYARRGAELRESVALQVHNEPVCPQACCGGCIKVSLQERVEMTVWYMQQSGHK